MGESWFPIAFLFALFLFWLRLGGVARALCSWMEAIQQELARANRLRENQQNQQKQNRQNQGNQSGKKFSYLTGGR